MEKVDMQLILSKLRSKEDRVNFMREIGKRYFIISGFYLPTDRGFDGKFFIQVLKGEKNVIFLYNLFQLLRIGQIGGVNFPWFTKSKHFTKNHLLSFFVNDLILRTYLPDDIKLESIKRSYLLNVRIFYNFQVLFVVKKNKYNQLYGKYKLIKASRYHVK